MFRNRVVNVRRSKKAASNVGAWSGTGKTCAKVAVFIADVGSIHGLEMGGEVGQGLVSLESVVSYYTNQNPFGTVPQHLNFVCSQSRLETGRDTRTPASAEAKSSRTNHVFEFELANWGAMWGAKRRLPCMQCGAQRGIDNEVHHDCTASRAAWEFTAFFRSFPNQELLSHSPFFA